jgi:hypothetical protein
MTDIYQKLKAPFDPNIIKWRVGSTTADKKRGLALCYIDARAVIDRLDEVMGPQNWQSSHTCSDGKTICRIGLRIDNEWIWKSDGAGDTQIEADKGAISDALKRAAVQWGIGRYLYDFGDNWVALDNRRIAKGEYATLAAIVGAPAPKAPSKKTDTPSEPQNEPEKPKPAPTLAYTTYDREGSDSAVFTDWKTYRSKLEIPKLAQFEPWRDATYAELQRIGEWTEANVPDKLVTMQELIKKIEQEIEENQNG